MYQQHRIEDPSLSEISFRETGNSDFELRNSFLNEDSGYLSFSTCSNTNLSICQCKCQAANKNVHKYRSKPYLSKSVSKLRCSETVCSFNQHLLQRYSKNGSKNFLKDFSANTHSEKITKIELKSCHQNVSSCFCKNRFKSFQGVLCSPHSTVYLSPIGHKDSLNDSDMKLVLPQSTPCFIASTLKSPLCNIGVSPISYKSSLSLSSENSKRFKNLVISEDYSISISNIKTPKKLDFSKRAILASFRRQRAIPDYNGKERLDIFKLLGENTNHPRIVSKILSYLSPQDLCSISLVSKSWYRICNNDGKAQERRLKHILLKQYSKENFVAVVSKSKYENSQLSPKTRYPRRGFLTAVSTNLLQVPKIHLKQSSPPVSPSKVIFHSFVKASRTLAPSDQLVPCPQCKFACRIKHEMSIGTCSRKGCSVEEFCILCSTKAHAGQPCKMPLLATPTKRNKHQPIVGTRQCKKNLRRISRLI